MAQTIKIKRSTVTAAPSSLQNGELAYSSLNEGKLFIGRPGGTTGDIDVIGGRYYTLISDALVTDGKFTLSGDVTGSSIYNSTTKSWDIATSIAPVAFTDDASTSINFNVPDDDIIWAGGTYLTSTVAKTGTDITVTFSHDNSGVVAGTYGTTSAIPAITVDAQGHITSITTNNVATALTIQDDATTTTAVDLLTDTLVFAGGTYLTSSITATGVTDTITFSHDATTRTDTTSSATKISGDTFTAVDSVTTNAEGHVTAINVKTVTLADTLDSVTDAGNTTTNDIQVNNIRVNGGNITGPATITIDPDGVGATGTVIIAGDLTVQGTTTTINSNTVSVGDNIIVLNGDETGTPSQNAGIEVERGTSANVSLRWNETLDLWQLTTDGTAYQDLITDTNFEVQITTLDGGTF